MRAVAARADAAGEAQLLLSRLQPRLRPDASAATPGSIGRMAHARGIVVIVALIVGWHRRVGCRATAHRVHPDRGPGLRDDRRAAAGRRRAGPHAGGAEEGDQTRAGHARRGPGGVDQRHLGAGQQRDAAERRRRLCDPEGLERSAARAPAPTCCRCTCDLQAELDKLPEAIGSGSRSAADPGHRQRQRLHHAGGAARRQLRLREAAERSAAPSSPTATASRACSGSARRSAPACRSSRCWSIASRRRR